MTRCLRAGGLAGLLMTFALPAAAQWPSYPTNNVPRTADGEPDLMAPAPRTADGHVDFTGVWEAGLGFGGGGGGRGGFGGGGRGGFGGGGRGGDGAAPAGPAGAAVAGGGAGPGGFGGPPPGGPPAGGPPGGFGGGRGGPGRGGSAAPSDSPPVATFFDIGANIEGGAPYQDWARELRDERVANGMKDNPDAHCLPMGPMQFHLHPQPRKMIQTDDILVILYEGNAGIRQIFLDGRGAPDNDPWPWWYGYSHGWWEGDELVVETTHIKDTWLDVNGSPFTENGRTIERFRRPNFGTVEIDVTIDDPTAYTEPFTVRVNQRILLDEELIEFICIENEQSSEYFD